MARVRGQTRVYVRVCNRVETGRYYVHIRNAMQTRFVVAK